MKFYKNLSLFKFIILNTAIITIYTILFYQQQVINNYTKIIKYHFLLINMQFYRYNYIHTTLKNCL